MTGPRRLPTWTVPDGVLESLTTCGPASRTRCASSSAQSIHASRLLSAPVNPEARSEVRGGAPRRHRPEDSADAGDLVREVARGHLHDDLLALLLAQERATDGALIGDPAFAGLRLGRADDRERLLAVAALDADLRADLDVVGRMVLVDDRGVLDQRLERLDPALDERLLVLGVLVLGVLGQVAVLLGIVDPIGDLGSLDRDHVLELRAELLEAILRDVCGLAVHRG